MRDAQRACPGAGRRRASRPRGPRPSCSSRMSTAVAVQPMPGLPMPCSAASMTAMLAASTAAPRRTSSAVPGACSPTVSTAMELATSPAAWPPMPSETMKRGGAQQEGVLVVASHEAHVAAGAPGDELIGARDGVRADAPLHGDLGAAGGVGGLLGGDRLCLGRRHPRLTRMMVSAHLHLVALSQGYGLVDDMAVDQRAVGGAESSSTSAGPWRVRRACVEET